MKNRFHSITLEILADRMLVLASGMMLLFFLSFIAVLWQVASAAAAQDCTGRNLLLEYARSDPARLAEIEAEAAAVPNGEGVFWKIAREGLAPSYLLGTMHMADDRIARLEGAMREAFEASHMVVVESVEALDEKAAMAGLIANKNLTLITDGNTLDRLLDPETTERLKVAVEERGMPFAVARVMQPWVVAASVGLPACEIAEKRSGKPVLDAMIAGLAKEDGKELVGLETMKEQFEAIAGLPQDFHLQALKETLALGDTALDITQTMKQLYLDGHIGWVNPLLRVAAPKTSGSQGYADFQERLIDRRNALMAERARPYLAKGGAFIAVGALHLPGEKGLVEAFREMGYTLSRAD